MPSHTETVHELIHGEAVLIDAGEVWLDRLVEEIGNAHLVLLGEATHGTEEFYALRARITQRPIQNRGFRIVAVEADWPDAFHGTVSAASDWDGPVERKRVRDAREDSYEYLLHEAERGDFLLPMTKRSALSRALSGPLFERAIGVIYRPDTELASHHFHASLPAQFDTVIHVDESTALTPLERSPVWDESELPETYPFGI
jgi:erythromycin esterase-like protein